MQKAIEIQGASEIDVDFDKELKNLVQKGALLKNEGREVEKLLMNNNPDDGVQAGHAMETDTGNHRLCKGTAARTLPGTA